MVARLTNVIKNVKDRDSNMELLRIICMLLILIHHFIIHPLYPSLLARDGDINIYRIACIVICGFAFVGVNCFIMISGYYGIKFRFKSLFNLYCICAFYALLAVLMKYVLGITSLDKNQLYLILLPFSHSEWWFIKCYVALFLISPILNAAADKLTKNDFACSLILLTILNIYFGFYWHEHNYNGYNLVQFIYVYLIGAYLRRYPLTKLDIKRSVFLYISCSVIWSILTTLSLRWRVPHWGALHYNNPFVLLASIGLFISMSRVTIHNQKINLIASSVLAAYLIQDVEEGWVYYCSALFNKTILLPLNSVFLKAALMIAFVLIGSITVLGASFLIDRIRIQLMKPVWMFYEWTSNRLKIAVSQ